MPFRRCCFYHVLSYLSCFPWFTMTFTYNYTYFSDFWPNFVVKSSQHMSSGINEHLLQTWWVSHLNEFCWQHWQFNGWLRSSRSARRMLIPRKDNYLVWHTHNPFERQNSWLCSLSSGLTAVDKELVNCDNAEIVGAAIISSMSGKCFTDVVLRKKESVKTLVQLQKGVPVQGVTVHLNTQGKQPFNNT